MKLAVSRCLRQISNGLFNCIVSLSKEDSTKNLLKNHFQRKRKIPLFSLIKFLMTLDCNDIFTNMLFFYHKMGSLPTPAALCKRRNDLPYQFLQQLFQFYTHWLSCYVSKHGTQRYLKKYTLLACDGSDFVCEPNPSDSYSYFQNENCKGYNEYHVNAIYNVISHFYLRVCILPKAECSERKSFLDMAADLPKNGNLIYTLDRGYEGWDIILHVINSGNYFVMRIKQPESNGILSGIPIPDGSDNHSFDFETSVHIYEKTCHSKVSVLHPDAKVPRLTNRNTGTKVKVRFLKLQNASGNDAIYLATNLPGEAFSTAQMSDLYHTRWGIETSFKELKHDMSAIVFHTKQKDKIYQELYAKLIMFNFTGAIWKIACETYNRTSAKGEKYRVSFARIVDLCRAYISGVDMLKYCEKIIHMSMVPVRPGRSYPRKRKVSGPRYPC